MKQGMKNREKKMGPALKSEQQTKGYMKYIRELRARISCLLFTLMFIRLEPLLSIIIYCCLLLHHDPSYLVWLPYSVSLLGSGSRLLSYFFFPGPWLLFFLFATGIVLITCALNTTTAQPRSQGWGWDPINQ